MKYAVWFVRLVYAAWMIPEVRDLYQGLIDGN